MKQTMIFAIIILTAIVMAASFDLHIIPQEPLQIPASLSGQALYVCPAASQTWDTIATMLRPFQRYITVGIFFVIMILCFNWGWALYQNLLSDKFKQDAFKTPWQFTKFTFWMIVAVVIISFTPNYFRRVTIDGASGEWVLCENTTPGARAVRADAVH